MGKTKAKKRSLFRYRPTGLPSVKEAQIEAQESAGTIEAKTLPLVEKVGIHVKLMYMCSLISSKQIPSANYIVRDIHRVFLQNAFSKITSKYNVVQS